MIWINGFNLGRYWPVAGPQITLYLPASLLKPHPETNTFVLFELERAPDSCLSTVSSSSVYPQNNSSSNNCVITLTDTHEIDSLTPFQADDPLFKKY